MAEIGREHATEDERATAAPLKGGIPRTVEALVAIAALAALSPVLGAASLAVALTSRGPVLFRQRRVGRGGREFVLYKLRTMRVGEAGPQVTARDDERVTRVGRFLRRTKLDELPELWNVFKGDMSLIGPRPEVARYVDLDNPLWRMVLEARPGLTDPVTLRLRNEETLLACVEGDREKFYLETLQPFKLSGYLEYMRARNWRADVRVLWQTLRAIMLPGRVAPLTSLELNASPEEKRRLRAGER
ncbi:MAG TPA: sugar transferase [Pyrinomonadaceae bacterium]|jgi:lipopolysaccharide/colanic/teichoic acid biosynthesis glycosyltransferase